MNKPMMVGVTLLAFLSPSASHVAAAASKDPLASIDRLAFVGSRGQVLNYRGRQALELMPLEGDEHKDAELLAIVTGSDFKDGVLEIDVAGAPRPDSGPTTRGFIGIAFRVQGAGEKYECFYVRPTNGRSEEQILRNHSVQYVGHPDFGWKKLRDESPGVYESYADLEPGVWTHLRVEVAGTEARCYVNGATQPTLIVHDLKLGDTRGPIALWSHTTTVGYFSKLKVK